MGKISKPTYTGKVDKPAACLLSRRVNVRATSFCARMSMRASWSSTRAR